MKIATTRKASAPLVTGDGRFQTGMYVLLYADRQTDRQTDRAVSRQRCRSVSDGQAAIMGRD
jgi:hypothetical protein